jgi:hypothetical protein
MAIVAVTPIVIPMVAATPVAATRVAVAVAATPVAVTVAVAGTDP